MGRSFTRDAGASTRGGLLIPVLIGAGGVASSLAASPGLHGAFGAGLALLMVAIAVSDFRHFIVPNVLTATAFGLGLIYAGLFDPIFDPMSLAAAVLWSIGRAVAAALPFLALMLAYEWWRGRPGLGMGDVKLAAVAGVWLDWFTIVAVIEVAALAALATYLVGRYVLRRPFDAATPLPFGLFLAPAIWLGWIAEMLLLAR